MTLPSTERRAFIAALAGGLLGAPRAGWAQAAKATRVVGHLAASSPSPENTRLLGAFHAGLRERAGSRGRPRRAVRSAAPARHGAGPGSGGPHRAGGTPNAVAARAAT